MAPASSRAVKPDPTTPPVDERLQVLAFPKQAGRTIVTFWMLFTAFATAWFFTDERAFWTLVGGIACLIISLPLVLGRRQYEVVSPWTLLLLGGYLGWGLRGLFISWGIEADRTLDELYFLGNTVEYFYGPSLIFLFGLGLLTAGYLCAPASTRSSGIGRRAHLATGHVQIAVLLSALVGFIAFMAYAQATGGIGLGQLSAKRTTITGAELDQSFQSHGGLRVINTYAQLAFWLQTAYYCYRGLPHGPTTLRFWWLAALFINAAMLPLYASTRSDLIYIVIGALLIEFCLRRSSVNVRTIGVAAVSVLVIGSAMTSLRSTSTEESQTASVDAQSMVAGFVLSRTVADVATTSHIIHVVPEGLPYANGRTITAWLSAPIPRSVWPGKPIISLGPEIGRSIYGNDRSGVPPGVVGEAYWNFGLTGVLVLPFLAGLGLRRLHETWARSATVSPEAAIILAIVAVRPGLAIISNSLGYVIFQVVQSLILLIPILIFVGRDKPELAKTPVQRRSTIPRQKESS